MKKNIGIKKALQQIPVKELREFVEQQTGKNQKERTKSSKLLS